MELARLPASATGLGLVVLLSIPALRTFVLQKRKGAARDNFYQDRDGKSTPEAIASFSNRRHKIALLLSSVIGLATSVALSVVVTLDQTQHKFCVETWLNTASWVGQLPRPASLLPRRDVLCWSCHCSPPADSHPVPSDPTVRHPCSGRGTRHRVLDIFVLLDHGVNRIHTNVYCHWRLRPST